MLVVDGREDRRVEELDSQLDQVVLDEIPQVQHVEAGMGEEGVNGRGDVWRRDAAGLGTPRGHSFGQIRNEIRNDARTFVWEGGAVPFGVARTCGPSSRLRNVTFSQQLIRNAACAGLAVRLSRRLPREAVTLLDDADGVTHEGELDGVTKADRATAHHQHAERPPRGGLASVAVLLLVEPFLQLDEERALRVVELVRQAG